MHERLTADTKPGRKLRAKANSEGAPLLRLTSGRLKKAGIERVARVAETRHGMPVLGDGRSVAPGSIVWATGYRHSYAWTGAETDEHGVPLHERGVVRGEPGMYVLGLPFIHTLTSAFTGGVGRDAEYVARQIEARSAIESARRHSVEYAGRAA